MSKRNRTAPDTSSFEDPLCDYEAVVHDDAMERALCEDPVTAIGCTPVLALPPDVTVRRAVTEMADANVASVIVVEDEKPVGIFSERDVLHRVSLEYAHVLDRPLRELMTPDPVVVFETDHPSRVLNLMAAGGFRHLPVVDADGKLTGMIGCRRVTDYLQQHLAPSEA